jgi:hypothetical protein
MEDSKFSISITWNIEDVLSLDNSLNNEECISVLQAIEDNHDCNIGINWDVIQFYIDREKSFKY